MKSETLEIDNFGPIRRAEVTFKDITVLVGPQATGKSLVCQWLKLLKDRNSIAFKLSRYGSEIERDGTKLLSLFFGASYRNGWRKDSDVHFGNAHHSPQALAKRLVRKDRTDRVAYIPAHRAMVLTTGYPGSFRTYRPDVPFVVRDFSERLLDFFNKTNKAFPISGRYHKQYRSKLDEAIFHSGKVDVVTAESGERSLKLVHADQQFSVMEWTTGQREVLPLLVGLYDVLPSGGIGKRDGVDWVVVEEPELGLHPDAIVAVMVLLLDAVRRGYRLVMSTHSPLVLDLLWAIRQINSSDEKNPEKAVLKLLRLGSNPASKELAAAALAAKLSVVHMDFDDGAVMSRDISTLDPFSSDAAISGWGGLIEHNSRVTEVVSEVS